MNWTTLNTLKTTPASSTCTGRGFELWAIQNGHTWRAIYMDSYGSWVRDGYSTEQEARHAAETRLFAAIEANLPK